jgi:zinc protease
MTPVDRTRLPAPAPEPPFAFPAAAKRRLESGLGLWAVERRSLPIVSIVLLLPAGSVWDPPGRPGLAAMTADMLDEGSGGRSAVEIQEALARIGAELDTEIGPDSLVLSLTLLDRFVPVGLQLLADVAVRPSMAAADFDRVRALRVNRIRQLRDVPSVNADAVLLKTLYGAHPYGHLSLGSAASLDGFEPADAVGFHRSHFDPARATLIAVGAITPDAFAREADAAFRGWIRGGQADALAPAALVSRPQPRLLLVDRPGAAQTELRVGHVGVPRKTDAYYPLVVANAVLGGQFMSRLNLNLRERRGCTYGVRSGFDFRRLAGPFSVQTSVQTSATADAVSQILEEMEAIRGPRPAAGDELALAAATLTKGYPGNFETTGQVARAIVQLVLHDLPDDSFAQFAPRIRAVTPDAATGAARAHIDPDAAVVVAVGDSARIRGGLEALGLGDAVATTSGL